jgi:glycosyltransferase involved in cell wall biosynthesis
MFAMRFARWRIRDAVERMLLWIERAALAFSDAVVTVHEPYKRELVANGVAPGKVTVVMNSVDEALLEVEPCRRADGFRVFYHGTVTPHYGVHLLVEALAELAEEVPQAELEICGEGDAVEMVRARARELGVDDRLRMSGEWVSHREALARAREASVGVIPNLPIPLNRYALSSKLFEYLVLGIPAVSAELPTIRDHFGPDELAFFEPGSSSSLAEVLRSVASDPDAAAERVAAARRRYEAYKWSENARRYLALLDSLVTA